MHPGVTNHFTKQPNERQCGVISQKNKNKAALKPSVLRRVCNLAENSLLLVKVISSQHLICLMHGALPLNCYHSVTFLQQCEPLKTGVWFSSSVPNDLMFTMQASRQHSQFETDTNSVSGGESFCSQTKGLKPT